MITENLSTLKIHKLSQTQYERELAAGNIDPNALYLTPDEAMDLSSYVTIDQLNSKADADHTHNGYADVNHSHSEYALADHTHDNIADSNHTHSYNDLTDKPVIPTILVDEDYVANQFKQWVGEKTVSVQIEEAITAIPDSDIKALFST